jgi:predicted  nucleic acid-binding Zn-ribbon protein
MCRKPLAFCVFLQSKEHMCRISDLQEELRHREHHITDLDKEVQHLHENINTLTKELELKGKEILRVRSESNQQMRYASTYSRRCIVV